MKDIIVYRGSTDQFQVDYPYYGLFNTAAITTMQEQDEMLFQCKLLNGSILLLKKSEGSKKWIDASLNIVTPLASVIGMCIDDFLKMN